MSLRRRLINIDIFDFAYRINARLEVSSGGVHYELSDPNSNYFNLQDIYVSRTNSPGTIEAQYPEGAISKRNFSFILLQDRNDGIATTVNSIYTSGKPIPVFLTLPGFDISGTVLYQTKTNSAQELLFQVSGDYLIVFNGVATSALYPDVPYHGDLLLINKARVGVLCKANS